MEAITSWKQRHAICILPEEVSALVPLKYNAGLCVHKKSFAILIDLNVTSLGLTQQKYDVVVKLEEMD
jgi:hypothetical protein